MIYQKQSNHHKDREARHLVGCNCEGAIHLARESGSKEKR